MTALRAVGDADFAEHVRGGDAVLVDFWAPWCGPCRQLAPVLDALQADLAGRLTVVKLNVDENPATAAEYGVTGLPALILFSGGVPVHRMLGLRPRAVAGFGLSLPKPAPGR